MTSQRAGEDDVIVSYLTLRKVVGGLGVGLPLIVLFWGLALGSPLLPSISDYYNLRTRDAFVGILVTIAWFMFTYHGPEREDNIAGNLACLFALGVALFPNSGSSFERVVHFSSATALFLVLAYFSLVLFTRSGPAPTPEKKQRNQVYRVCGIIMLVCIVLIPLCNMTLRQATLAAYRPVFWLEAFALWAFGFSWAVKGEVILGDRNGA